MNPPRWPIWLLVRLCPSLHLEILLGDLQELYRERRVQNKKWKADVLYVLEAFDLSWRSLAFERKTKNSTNTAMLKNYLKVTYRNFLRQKVYSLINLSGLAIGIACCVLICIFIYNIGRPFLDIIKNSNGIFKQCFH